MDTVLRQLAMRAAITVACWFGVNVDAAMLTAQSSRGNGRAVLVTGASSGIGRKIAETLAADGFFVYAGARKPEDLQYERDALVRMLDEALARIK